MIHRNSLQCGPRAFHAIAVSTLLMTFAVANAAMAAQPNSQPTSPSIANKTLNVFCRAANLPNTGLSEERVPAEWFLSPDDAKITLDAIQRGARTQKQLCPATGAPPPRAEKFIKTVGVDPINNPHHNSEGKVFGGADPINNPTHNAPAIIRRIQDVVRQLKGE